MLKMVGTPKYNFVGKYPPTKGKFYMDIIAGHTSTAAISSNEDYHDIFMAKKVIIILMVVLHVLNSFLY